VTWLPVGDDGSVAPAALREALQANDDVALVSIMWANNEVGTIMPITELATIAAEFDVPMHSDAIQAVGQVLSTSRRARCRDGARPTSSVVLPGVARCCCAVTPPVCRCCTVAARMRDVRSGTTGCCRGGLDGRGR